MRSYDKFNNNAIICQNKMKVHEYVILITFRSLLQKSRKILKNLIRMEIMTPITLFELKYYCRK